VFVNLHNSIELSQQYECDLMTLRKTVEYFDCRLHYILNKFVVPHLWLKLISTEEIGIQVLLNLGDHKLGRVRNNIQVLLFCLRDVY
jgi:hypothetical protein